jgi:chromosome segregation ATPase
MALAFMAFSMALYTSTSQRNWRDIVILKQDQVTPNKDIGLESQLKTAKDKNEELTKLKASLETQYAAEKVLQQQALSKLQTELDQAKKERKEQEAVQAGLDKEKNDAVAAMKSTQTKSTGYQKQLKEQQAELAQDEKERDEHFDKVVRKTDELNQAVIEKEQLRKRTADLAKDLAKADKALKGAEGKKD